MVERAPSTPDVFLSYAHEDEARARELATALGQCGLAVFWDREVPPGRTWHNYIGEALASARCVVVAWSSHSIASQWVIEEASEGKDRDALVPVLFEAVQPPFGFRAIQAASLIDWHPGRSSPAFDSLASAVHRIVGGQRGSGADAQPEAAAPPPASSEPTPKTAPAAPPATPSPASRETRAAPVMPAHGQAGAWPRRTVLAMVAALFAIGTAGAVFWSRSQPEPTLPAPEAEIAPAAPEERAAGAAVEPERTGQPSVPAETEAPTPPQSETAQPGDEIRDCPECPEMVLVPAGEFTMGSPPGEPGRSDDEGPQREVTIAAPFWVGKYEVTFAEWTACVAAGGCGIKPDDAGWGRGSRPVINVSWNDAKQYVGWLSQKSGKTYRLLSEAEWEYAARAGTRAPFSLPAPDGSDDIVGKGIANCAGCGSQWDNTKTAPAGSFEANEFGLYDTAGNVWEWVEDCWHDSYHGAPTDGSAWVSGGCATRVLRGGSWDDQPRYLRSALRVWLGPANRFSGLGFRVARAPD